MKTKITTLLSIFSILVMIAQSPEGELKRWHKITLDFEGPNTTETASTNPFADYRLDVTFRNGNKTYVVPGFYSGCSNPEDTSCDSGNIWKVNFAPDRTGTWSWTASFKTGNDIAITTGGASAGFMDGDTGSFVISESDKSGRDFRSADLGRLQYVGEHYLKHSGTNPDNPNGPWFVKVGADSPENTFAYEDFDNTPNRNGRLKEWAAHQQDYVASEASQYTWDSGKGTELLGVVNYLASEGANAMSFLTFSLGGDDENVFPHLLRVSENVYNGFDDDEQWADGVHKDRFDVSKLAQWERILQYADQKGMYLHFKTMETENDNFMDRNENGRERKLYYRELIARFGHHLALNWNITEESTLDDDVAISVSEFIHAVDPYDHNIVIHTFPSQKDRRYGPLLGNNSELTGASLQSDPEDIHDDVIEWRENSSDAGKKWIVANDEQGSASTGIQIDDEDIRHEILYGALMAGGAGVEYYYGSGGTGDLNNQNHRDRGVAYEQAGHAIKFFQEYFQDYLIGAESDDRLTGDSDDYVFANEGRAYAVYLPNGGSTSLSLPSGNGNYNVQWFNPRSGDLGSASTLGNTLSAPDSNNDWVALIKNSDDDGNVNVNGGTITGGPFEFTVGDGIVDNVSGVALSGNVGANSQWVVTDDQRNILGLPPTPEAVDFDVAGTGTCFIYHLSYEDGLTGLEAGNNLSALEGDFDLSNRIDVLRELEDTDGGGTPTCDVFEEVNGVVVIEAENRDVDFGEWNVETTALNNSFTGNGYLEFTGNSPTNGDPNSPIEYQFKINDPGLYSLHLRCARETVDGRTDLANDCYVRVEGDYDEGPDVGNSHGDEAPLEVLQSDTKFFGGNDNSFVWASGNKLDLGGHNNKRRAIYDFKAGETYTLVVSGRSQLFKLDRIMFRKTSVNESDAESLDNVETFADDCDETGTPSEENTPPTVEIDTPLNNSVFEEGVDIRYSANANDADGSIQTVEFFIDGELIRTERLFPYNGTMSGFDNGTYTLTAIATDNDGASTTSAPVIVTIGNDITPPTGDTISIPGNFEAEDYAAISGSIRSEATPGTSGENLGFIKNNDYAEYAVSVARSGTYTFDVFASSRGAGGTVNIFSNNVLLGSVDVPANGEWHDYTAYQADIALSSGEQTLKFVFNEDSTNFLLNIDRVAVSLSEANAIAERAALAPVNDAYLQGDRRYNSTNIRVENGNRVAYLMYDLSGIEGTIETIDLQYSIFSDKGNGNVNVNLGTSNNWTETNLSNANKPDAGVLLGNLNGTFNLNSTQKISLDVSEINGDTLTLVLTATSGNDFDFGSKENTNIAGPTLLINDNSSNKGISISGDITITVYPNPVVNMVNFEGANIEGAKVKVYNLLGSVVKEAVLGDSVESLDMSGLASGVYFVNVSNISDDTFINEVVKVIKK